MSELPWVVPLLGGLLVCSAFFSGAETALFSLGEPERRLAGRHVQRLLGDPRSLLVTLLFGNLVVNILYFAFASRLEVEGEYGHVVVVVGALLVLLCAGEIFPKTLALAAPLRFARLCAPPLEVLVVLLLPVRSAARACLELVVRALGTSAREERGITTEELASVLERSAKHGLLEGSEAGLLAEVVELSGIRVREIMTPRVDLLVLDLEEEDPEPVIREALAQRLTWLPVVQGRADAIVGVVRLRDLLAKRERSPAQLVMPVKFVPEVASATDLLRDLRESRASEAVVVDEWGGTAGVVTLEDVFEEIVGDLRAEGESELEAVVDLGGGRFRVAGSLSVRDWNEQFGHTVVPTEFETVAGFVTALLGRIPRAGDRVRLGNLVNEVHEVRGRRVISVDMHVVEGLEGAAA